MKTVRLFNPATGVFIREYSFSSEGDALAAVDDAAEAFQHWRKVDIKTRLQCVQDFAHGLKASREPLAEMMTLEMGKLLKESLGEIDKSISSCQSLCENYLVWKSQREYVLPSGHAVYLEPMGPLLGIMPWNFPLWQVVRFAIPALLAGNTVLLKHAPNTWGSAELIADVFRQAFPDCAYVNLQVDVDVAQKLIAHPRVRGVSLTGSVRAGRSVARVAGENLKKCVLELGGSDAYVILDDADIDEAARLCVASRLINAGQSCVSAKRFIVTRKNISRFTEGFVAAMKRAQIGEPRDPHTSLAPLARQDLREGLRQQVEQSLSQGAKLLLGGGAPEHPGYFYEATVLSGVRPGQVAFDDELFGPVGALIEARDEAEALAFANHSRYGLGGAIFSQDQQRAQRLAQQELDCGMVAINDFIRSDVAVPFGGVKDSGIGRELGREGVFEFTNVKMVYQKP